MSIHNILEYVDFAIHLRHSGYLSLEISGNRYNNGALPITDVKQYTLNVMAQAHERIFRRITRRFGSFSK